MFCYWQHLVPLPLNADALIKIRWRRVGVCRHWHLVPLLLNADVLINIRCRSVLFCRGKWEKQNKSPDTAFQWPKFHVKFQRRRKKLRILGFFSSCRRPRSMHYYPCMDWRLSGQKKHFIWSFFYIPIPKRDLCGKPRSHKCQNIDLSTVAYFWDFRFNSSFLKFD